MDFINQGIDFVLHLDNYLNLIIQNYGNLTYVFLFLIIFVETGLVVAPFLPGDSLIFAAGAFAGQGALNIYLLFGLLAMAAILGDTVNYWIGYLFGEKIIASPKIKIVNRKHLEKTQAFFDKYGGKTIIIARFVPIVRTFAPFMAGVGRMNYPKFLSYNVIGGIFWTGLFSFGGYFFGNIRFVQENFSLVIIIIIALSIIPAIIEFIKASLARNKKEQFKQGL